MNISTIVNSAAYKDLSYINNLKSSKIVEASSTYTGSLFSIDIAANTLYKDLKKVKFVTCDVKEVRKTLAKIANQTAQLLDQEFEKAIVSEELKKMRRRFSRIEKALKAEYAAEFAQKVHAISLDDLQGLQKKEKVSKEELDEIQKIVNQNINVIKNLQHHSLALPSNQTAADKSSFYIFNLPLVVLTNVTGDDFKKAGFDVQTIDKYVVLNHQLVLGVNPAKIEKGYTVEAWLKAGLASLENKTGQKYSVMDGEAHYRGTKIAYFWVVPEKQLNMLLHNTGKTLSFRQWGFAFK